MTIQSTKRRSALRQFNAIRRYKGARLDTSMTLERKGSFDGLQDHCSIQEIEPKVRSLRYELLKYKRGSY